MSDASPIPQVYAKIAAVAAEISKAGVSKSRKNEQQGYKFRGIDEVMNALSPILAANGLVILPRVLTRTCEERTTKSGALMFYVVVEMAFDFIAAVDGSKHTVQMFGEAMDSADKATNKAMSAAYKYAAFQAFCIPLEGTPDADASHPEVAAEPEPVRRFKALSPAWQTALGKGFEALKLTKGQQHAKIVEFLVDDDTEQHAQRLLDALRADFAAKTKKLKPTAAELTNAVKRQTWADLKPASQLTSEDIFAQKDEESVF